MARMSFEDMTKDLEITEVWIAKHEHCPNGVIGIEWSAPNCGFGRYELVLGDDGKFHADSEHMDNGEDKKFLKLLLSKLPDIVVIED